MRTIAALGLLLTLSVAEARTPDFSGVWERYPDPYEGDIDYPPPPGGPPALKAPYASAYEAAIKKRDDAVKRGEPLIDASARCLPEGMPTMMAGTYDLEILHGKDDVVVLAEFLSQTRRIFLGASMPPVDEVSPSYNGFSVGHWEGDTLVVQTAGVRTDVPFMSMPHSKNMRITERIRLVAPDKLEDHVVIDDPEVFAKPYTFTYGYRRDPGYRIIEYICDNNRWQPDANGKATLKTTP